MKNCERCEGLLKQLKNAAADFEWAAGRLDSGDAAGLSESLQETAEIIRAAIAKGELPPRPKGGRS